MSSLSDSSILAGGSGAGESVYQIDQSIRFNDDDTAYMSKTFTSSNRKTLTFSCWVKRGNQGTNQNIFGPQTNNSGSGTYGVIRLNPQNELDIFDYTNGTTNWRLQSTQLLRDSSAWYHFVFSMDTSNSISSERLRMFINGQRVTDFDVETYPSLNYQGQWNNNLSHEIGAIQRGSSNQYLDGYLAEIHFLDGYAYGPEYFGEFNSSNIWIPKEYTGSYGTNGFYIKGEDSSDLGNDSSGNNNDFTTSGLNPHDQVLDSPTNNFCVMNPVNTHSSMTLSNGNLQSTASAHTGSGGTILLPSTGKWYCEFRYNSGLNNEYPVVGVYNIIKTLTTQQTNPGKVSGDLDVGFGIDGRRNEDDTNTGSWGNSVTNGKIGALAIDMTNKKIWFGHNNSGSFVWQASGDPSAGTNEANTKDFADDLIFGNSHYAGSNLTWNFGQDGTFAGTETAQGNKDANNIGNFYYPVPTNYLALCTSNIGAD